MTDLTHLFNFNRPPNGSYTSQQGLGHSGQQQSTFDINEFPSLSRMSLLSQMQATSRANYVNIAKDNSTTNQSSVDSNQSEFTISSEDFPALPGSNNVAVSTIGTKASAHSAGSSSSGSTNAAKSSSSTSPATSSNIQLANGAGINASGVGNGSSLQQQQQQQQQQHQLQLQDGTTAAIDQCGRDNKPYFSPIGAASQKPMWMNGGIDQPNFISFPSDQCTKKGDNNDQVRLSDYSGQGNDFYELTNQNVLNVASMTGGGHDVGGPAGSAASINIVSGGANIGGGGITNATRKGVQITNDGRVTNIPPSMVTDQFGMIGLLAFLRAAETDPNLASVTFGTDLTALGLNLAAQEKLYPSFAGPWADQPLRVWEIDYPAPPEYLVSSSLREKLSQITLARYSEDTIFFLFYMFPNDMLQIAAALELFNREWRYHKEKRFWITRALGIGPSEKTQTYERGTYYYFDPSSWRRIPREFYLEYDRLESKPTLKN